MATLTNLRALARYFATGSSTSTDFSDDDTLRHANSAYQVLLILAFEASGDWQYQGDNKQTQSIVAGTRSYTLPTNFLRINRVEIKYPSSASEYQLARAIDYKNIDRRGLDDYVASWPQYDLKQNKLEIFVSAKTASIQAVTDGILIYHETELTELATGSDEPDIPEPFARLMAMMMASDYCLSRDNTTKYATLNREIGDVQKTANGLPILTGLKGKFWSFIASRNESKRMTLAPRREDFGEGLMGIGSVGDPTDFIDP